MTSPGKAIWTWHRVGFDYLDVGDPEGWQHVEAFQLLPPESLQRVIVRFGSNGQGAGTDFSGQLGFAGGLVQLQVFLQNNEGRTTYYNNSHPLHTTMARSPIGTAGDTFYNVWHALDPFDVDIDARARIPQGALDYQVGFQLAYYPLPEQDPGTTAYAHNWRTIGSLSYLVSVPSPI